MTNSGLRLPRHGNWYKNFAQPILLYRCQSLPSGHVHLDATKDEKLFSDQTLIPSPTPLPDTPLGSILEVGQPWRQQGLELTVYEVNLQVSSSYQGLDVCTRLKNQTPQTITFKIGAPWNHLIASDNRGAKLRVSSRNWRWNDSPRTDVFTDDRTIILEPGASSPLLDDHNCWFVAEDIGNSQVTQVVLKFLNISRISEAFWVIPILH
jgi:hypothetical protein